MRGGRPSHQASAAALRFSVRSTVPSAATNRRRTPGSPVTGSRNEFSAGSGTVAQIWQPSATLIRVGPPSLLVSAAAGTETLLGATAPDPPPPSLGPSAPGPITATLVIF